MKSKVKKTIVLLLVFAAGLATEHVAHEVADAAVRPSCHGEAATIWVEPDEGQGRDVIGTPRVRDVIVGGTGGNDFYNAGPGSLNPNTKTGPDLICGRQGLDLFYGGASGCNTALKCAEVWYGEAGGDIFYGGHGPEIVYGGGGNDIGWFYHGPLIFRGGPGNDHVYTGNAVDCPDKGPCKIIYGGKGFDHVHLCLPPRRVELHSVEEVHLFKDRFDVHKEHRFNPCAHLNTYVAI